MNSKICIVTGSRAEFGLLERLIKKVDEAEIFQLQLVVTGSHFSPELGSTIQEVRQTGLTIDKEVHMLISGDCPASINKSIAIGIMGLSDAYQQLNPDMVLILGDRYEMLAASIAAMTLRIPISHVHGGESTEGAFDEAIRHSITKMAMFHFVANDDYRRRVIQLGEDPERVYNVGGLGVDSILHSEFLSKEALEKKLNFEFGPKNLLFTYHPETLKSLEQNEHDLNEILKALSTIKDTKIIVTLANADTFGQSLNKITKDFFHNNSAVKIIPSLGKKRYYSALRQVDAVIGNSSSGLSEVPSFGIATINIGDRQSGRLKANSVIDCLPIYDEILFAINRVYQEDFKKTLIDVLNPYGNGSAVEKILNILREGGNKRFCCKKVLRSKRSFTS